MPSPAFTQFYAAAVNLEASQRCHYMFDQFNLSRCMTNNGPAIGTCNMFNFSRNDGSVTKVDSLEQNA